MTNRKRRKRIGIDFSSAFCDRPSKPHERLIKSVFCVRRFHWSVKPTHLRVGEEVADESFHARGSRLHVIEVFARLPIQLRTIFSGEQFTENFDRAQWFLQIVTR